MPRGQTLFIYYKKGGIIGRMQNYIVYASLTYKKNEYYIDITK